MFKRIIAALLTLALLVSLVPAGLADTVVHVYPEVGVTLLPDDQAALEQEFRAWAAELIYSYFMWDYGANPVLETPSVYDEYYRLGRAKFQFDSENTRKGNIYNMAQDGGNERNAVQMWTLLESLKEATLMNQAVLLDTFRNMPKSERIYLTFDRTTGGWKRDKYAANAQEQTEIMSDASWTQLTIDLVSFVSDLYAQYKYNMNPNSKDWISELISGAISSVENLLDTVVSGVETQALAAARNDVRQMLMDDMADSLANLNKESTAFLRLAYQDVDEMQIFLYKDLLAEFFEITDPESSDIYYHISDETQSWSAKVLTDANMETFMGNIGYDELQIIDSGTIVALGFTDFLGTLLEEAVTIVFDELEDAVKGKNVTLPGKLSGFKLSADALVEFFGDQIVSCIKETRQDTINTYYTNSLMGETYDASVLGAIGDTFVNYFKSKEFHASIASGLSEFLFQELAINLSSAGYYNEEELLEDIVGALVGNAVEGKNWLQNGNDLLSVFMKYKSDQMDQDYEDSISIWIKRKGEATEKRDKKLKVECKTQKAEQNKQKKLTEYNRTIREADREIEKKTKSDNALLEALCNVWDKASEAAWSVADLIETNKAKLTGEGRLSLWAALVYSAYSMSSPIELQCMTNIIDMMQLACGTSWDYTNKNTYQVICGTSWDYTNKNTYQVICDPTLVPIETVVNIVSKIRSQLRYDSVGTQTYYDIAVHLYEGKEFVTHNADGSKYYIFWTTDFYQYLNKNYTNIYGTPSILDNNWAERTYNKVVTMQNKYFDALWNDAWYVFFQ